MSKLSLHISGSPTGLDDLLIKCATAGSPISVLYSVNQNLAYVKTISPTTQLIYRRQSGVFARLPNDWYKDFDNANWQTSAQASATNWLIGLKDPADNHRTLLQNWQLNPADWYDPLNEPVVETGDHLKARWLNAWMVKALEIANLNGLKLALYSFPTGAPKLDVLSDLTESLILGKQSGAILSLHAYWESKNPATDMLDALYYRQVWQALPPEARLPIVITEASSGNGYNTAYRGLNWVNDMQQWDAEIMFDPYLLAGCAFQLGVNVESNLAEVMPAYGDYISTHPTPSEDTMGLNLITTEHLLPQDTTPEEYAIVRSQAEPLKQDILWSADVAKFIVERSLPGSKVIVWNPERWTNGNILNYLGVPTEVRHFAGPVTSLRLSNPVPSIPFRVTSKFNDPRNYANGKHEGLDLDAYDNVANKAVDVVAAADGVIETINEVVKPNTYGKFVTLRHTVGTEIYRTSYCHLGTIVPTLSVGNFIKQGDKLGVAGATGTTAIHLHLNLQWFGKGLQGYFVPDVIDPLPFIDVTETPPPPPPVNTVAKRGLHMRADGNSSAKDFDCLVVGKLNAAKIMTNTSFEEFATLRTKVPVENIVLRLYAAGDNPSLKNAAAFCDQQNLWLQEFNLRGGKYVEVHNEPNLAVEGLGSMWTTAEGFAAWYTQVYNWIKARYPNLQVGYPGLSPQANVPEWKASLTALLTAGKVDWIGAHSYWLNAADMLSVTGGQYYKNFVDLATQFNKIIIVTEFANVSGAESYTVKGQQYKTYYTTLDSRVWGAFAFVSSASDPTFVTSRQTWVVNNSLTDIPVQVGL